MKRLDMTDIMASATPGLTKLSQPAKGWRDRLEAATTGDFWAKAPGEIGAWIMRTRRLHRCLGRRFALRLSEQPQLIRQIGAGAAVIFLMGLMLFGWLWVAALLGASLWAAYVWAEPNPAWS